MTSISKELVDRFLSWQLPESVCADPICARPGNANEHRTGTNLMTHREAEQMLAHVLDGQSRAVEALNCWPLKELMQLVLLRGDDDMVRAAMLFTEVHKDTLKGAA